MQCTTNLSSIIIRLHVDELLVNTTSNLHIGSSLDELDTGNSTLRDDTGATAGLGAPCNSLTLGITNNGFGLNQNLVKKWIFRQVEMDHTHQEDPRDRSRRWS